MGKTDCQRSTWLLFSKFLDSWLYGVKSGFGSQYGVPIAKLKDLSTNAIQWTGVALIVSHVAAKQHQGCFQLLDLIITELKSHMTC